MDTNLQKPYDKKTTRPVRDHGLPVIFIKTVDHFARPPGSTAGVMSNSFACVNTESRPAAAREVYASKVREHALFTAFATPKKGSSSYPGGW